MTHTHFQFDLSKDVIASTGFNRASENQQSPTRACFARISRTSVHQGISIQIHHHHNQGVNGEHHSSTTTTLTSTNTHDMNRRCHSTLRIKKWGLSPDCYRENPFVLRLALRLLIHFFTSIRLVVRPWLSRSCAYKCSLSTGRSCSNR